MPWFIFVVGLLLLVLATPIALAWWKLSRKAAPYGDEITKPGRRQAADDAEVIILPTGDPKRGG